MDKIKTAIMAAIEETFPLEYQDKRAEIVKQTDFLIRDLSDSSIKLVELCMNIEERLGIEIEFSDLLDNPTFSGFSNWVHQKSGKA